jgi:hypothetical protein
MNEIMNVSPEIHPRYNFLKAKHAFLLSVLLLSPFSWIFEASGILFIAFFLNYSGIGIAGIGVIAASYYISSVFLPAASGLIAWMHARITGVVVLGCAGVTITASTVLVPLLFDSLLYRLIGFMVFLFTGNLILHVVRKILSDWAAPLLSGESGARFAKNLNMHINLAAMGALVLAGLFIDRAGNGSFWSFCVVFGAVFYSGWLSFQFLTDISGAGIGSLPETNPVPGSPAHESTFIRPDALSMIGFFISFALGMVTPFFSVFLVDSRFLGLSLTGAAFLVSVQIFFFTAGNTVWEMMKARYGSFPILRLSVILEAGAVFFLMYIYTWNSYLLPIFTALSGFALSGMTVSLGSMTSASPDEPQRKLSFLSGGSYDGFAAAAGAFTGGIVFSASGNPFPYGFSRWSALHLLFFVTSLLFLVIAAVLPFISRRTDKTIQSMAIDLVQGNPFLYIFHSIALMRAKTGESRVQAVIGLGKSRSPLALDMLTEALDDAAPEVRRNAALSLGKIRSIRALPLLIDELENRESDLRCEAAEALGKIGSRHALPSLFRALEDEDARVRNAAVTALSEIGGDAVRKTLMEKFTGPYDSDMFPTLADGLSRLGVTDIVEPVMNRLGSYQTVVFRLQLLNAVCRVLGAGNTFYRVLSKHEYARVNEVNKLIRHAQKNVQKSVLFKREPGASINRILDRIALSYREEDDKTFLSALWEFIAYIQLVMPEIIPLSGREDSLPDKERSPLLPYLEAVNRFLILKKTEDIKDEGMVFLVICIDCLLNVL